MLRVFQLSMGRNPHERATLRASTNTGFLAQNLPLSRFYLTPQMQQCTVLRHVGAPACPLLVVWQCDYPLPTLRVFGRALPRSKRVVLCFARHAAVPHAYRLQKQLTGSLTSRCSPQ
jgi:hypothetical protein